MGVIKIIAQVIQLFGSPWLLVPITLKDLDMSMFANNALLGGGVRVRVWIRKIKRRSKALLSL